MGLELKGWRGSTKVLEVDGLRKTFPDPRDPAAAGFTVLDGLDLLLWHGERVGLVGPNGAGKSLLYRLILGEEEPTAGTIVIGPSIEVGYYAQEHETLDPARTLIETIRRGAPLSEGGAVRFLGRFLFSYDQARGPVGDLSGGERSRLQLALLMLSGANFLLLDEPTNNLDIPSAEVLEDALEDFEGSVLVISHDRYFLDRVVGRIIEMGEGSVLEYSGSYSDYLAAKGGKETQFLTPP
jgi:ATP-binding cassette subfamily F protein 3